MKTLPERLSSPYHHPISPLLGVFLALLLIVSGPAFADPPSAPTNLVDIAELEAGVDPMTRVHGAGVSIGVPLGALGVPVAGGADVDGDGFKDVAIAHMISSPLGRVFAGEVNVVFGDGDLRHVVDLGMPQAGFLRIVGSGEAGAFEMAGNEIWMADVTGDGVGDLLICRQNYSVPSGGSKGGKDSLATRLGAGALTVIKGGPELRALAATQQIVDLASPPAALTVLNLVGAQELGRLGMWVRNGDVDGDGIDDFVVGADQESDAAAHHGAVYVVRGGAHLAQSATVDLADFGSTALAGQIARITPPANASEEFHLGATCQVADLDGNGRGEVIAAAALGRSAGSVGPTNDLPGHVFGGPGSGRVYVVWDDAFPAGVWPAGYHIDLAAAPGSLTVMDGGERDGRFGEELVGGRDYDGDGNADLFVGDLGGDGSENGDRPVSGLGFVLYDFADLKDTAFNIDAPPPGARLTTILGPSIGALGSDTVAEGDFDGDGIDDLMIGSPTANPVGRSAAGMIHIFYGRPGRWPRVIDTAAGALPPQESVRITEIRGARGTQPGDFGDILCYSATAADIDGDGKTDVISNEMAGNGIGPANVDHGNLIVLSGALVSNP